MDTEYSELNDDWITNFERNDKLYQDFYKDDIYYVNLKCVYVGIMKLTKLIRRPF